MSLYLSSVFLVLLTIFSSFNQVRAESLINFHASAGLGMRYSGWTFPFPSLNVNTKLGNGVLFVEGSASVLAFVGSVGYEYPLSSNGALYLAKQTGFTLGSDLSGYKIGYVYNSNGFNQSGWVTSIELYRFVKTFNNKESDYYMDKSSHVIPSISFGYQW